MNKKASAEITVFFSLIIVMILTLLFTLLESARSEGLRLKAQMCANSCIESVFASYDRYLWEDYGLLLFCDRYGGANEAREIALDYAKKNSGNNLIGNNFLSFNADDVLMENYVLATDDNGKVFRNAVCNYMKRVGIAEEIIDGAVGDDFKKAFEEDIFDEDGEIDFSKITKKIESAEDEKKNAEEKNDEAEDPLENNNANKEEATRTYKNLLSRFSDFKKRGFLSLVIGDAGKISESQYDLGDAPSKMSGYEKARSVADCSDDGIVSDVLFSEYLMKEFDCYLDDDYESLQIEYLISGKDSDLANLYSVANKLVAIRTGLNLVFMFTSSRCQADAKVIATAMVGWLLIPGLVETVETIILIIWAIAESVVDVKTLLAGGKVPLIKSDGDLQISLSSAASGGSGGSGSSSGLKYEDYLRGLLYLGDSEDISYRAMDIIQMHIRKMEPAFYMKNCIYAANINLNVTASSLFPFLPKRIDYKYSVGAAYSYGSVEKFY